jgi:hypothetical protein
MSVTFDEFRRVRRMSRLVARELRRSTTAPSAPKLDLKKLVLKSGSHEPDGEFCVMEAVAYVAGEKWSDSPKCASPSISGFLRCWNDGMNDEDRQMLKPLIPKLVNSRGSDDLERRRYMLAFDWTIREMVPTWLDAAMLHREASALRDLREFTDPAQLRDVPELSAARSAAGSAARSAAGSAAWYAAESAAWSAAGYAAGSAAESAAWSAAGYAAESAADAAWSAAGYAAGSAAGSAAWSAAWSAAGSALRPTVEKLQKSAFDLVERMLALKEGTP